MNEPKDQNEKLSYLWVAIFGFTGTNGLRGDVSKIKSDVERLSEWQREADRMVSTSRWLALGLISLLGMYATDLIVFAARFVKLGSMAP